jgi:Ni/Co efflux regulator RcnB
VNYGHSKSIVAAFVASAVMAAGFAAPATAATATLRGEADMDQATSAGIEAGPTAGRKADSSAHPQIGNTT